MAILAAVFALLAENSSKQVKIFHSFATKTTRSVATMCFQGYLFNFRCSYFYEDCGVVRD